MCLISSNLYLFMITYILCLINLPYHKNVPFLCVFICFLSRYFCFVLISFKYHNQFHMVVLNGYSITPSPYSGINFQQILCYNVDIDFPHELVFHLDVIFGGLIFCIFLICPKETFNRLFQFSLLINKNRSRWFFTDIGKWWHQ